MLNKVQLIGHLGADPEIRAMPNGDKVANLRLATSETWKDKAPGERKENTEWHRITVFNQNLVRVIEQYPKKGARLYIEGSLRTRKYTDNSGVEKYATEIVLGQFNGTMTLLDRAERQQAGPGDYGTTSTREGGERRPAPASGGGGRGGYDLDDDIPF